MIIKNKKADLSITLLVLMTLVLTIGSLVIFNIHLRKVGAEIKDPRFLDEIYMRENEINFYIDDLMEKSISKIEKGNTETEFIRNFKKELLNYKRDGVFLIKDFEQLEEQINEKNIEVKDGKIMLRLNIIIGQRFRDEFIAVYSYKKKFEKVFK